MMIGMSKNKQRRLQQALRNEKRHYKLFKSGKLWAVAGISLIMAGGMAFAQPLTAHAATSDDDASAATTQAGATIDNMSADTATNNVYTVSLSAGLTAPTWTAADFVTTAVTGSTTQYTVTLSAQGLAKLQQANLAANLSANSVKSGTLTVNSTKTTTTNTNEQPAQTTTASAKHSATTSTATTNTASTVNTNANTTTSSVKTATDTQTQAPQSTKTAVLATSVKTNTASAAKTTTTTSVSTASAQNAASSQPTTSANTNQSTAASTNTQADAAATTDTNDADTATKQEDAITNPVVTEESTNLGAADADTLATAKTAAAKAYAATAIAQKVTASSGAATAKTLLTASTTTVGYKSGATNLTLTYTINSAQKGDVMVVTIPTGAILNASANAITNASQLAMNNFGSFTLTAENGVITLTDTFTVDATNANITQTLVIPTNSNYGGQPKPLAGIGTNTYTITTATNGVTTQSLDYTGTITPNAQLSAVTRINPDNSKITTVVPNTEYVYTFAPNEADGVFDDASYPSTRVNSAVNYGTTITIPVPGEFTLDATTTASLNAFTDSTTISQPGGAGGDIIITVPKGSGSQMYESEAAYKIAGQFALAQSTDTQTITAAGAATMVQQIDDNGDSMTFTGQTWTEQMLGSGQATTQQFNVGAVGNSSGTPTQLVLDENDANNPASLMSFSFGYNSQIATTSANINLTIPDGLDATSLTLPTAGVIAKQQYLPGTTSYAYTITLADGSTMTGTAAAGTTITSTSAMRTVSLSPNYLAAGASSASSAIVVGGSLSSTYDNGATLKNGDTLTGRISLNTAENTTSSIATVSETVSLPTGAAALFPWDSDPTASTPGKKDSGYFSLIKNPKNANTPLVYEPIIYYVLPASATAAYWTGTQDALVTQSLSSTGQVIVKIDYTGTGEYVDMSTDTHLNNVVHVSNNGDALPGSYPFAAYILSPTTPLVQTTTIASQAATSTAAAAAIAAGVDPDAVQLSTEYTANWNWPITAASIVSTTTLAQGDEVAPVASATIDKASTNAPSFYINITNTKTDINNAAVVLNLPTKGDASGSTYTFNLNGPITLPTNFSTNSGTNTAMSATVYYATQAATLDDASTSPDLTGYVTADQITDWSSIRSVVIEFNTIPTNSATGRIALTGNITDMVTEAGATGYLAQAFYNGLGTTNVNQKAAQLTITGTSTVIARAHYVDANGQDQYIDLPDLNQVLNDNKDTLTDNYPKTTSDLSTTDQLLLPTGYVLKGSVALYAADGTSSAPTQFGAVATNATDGEIAQYELVAPSTLTVQLLDADNNNALITSASQDGTAGDKGTLALDPAALPAGFELADPTQSTINYTMVPGGSTITVYLKHIITKSTATTTRTISYTSTDGKILKTAVTQPLTWTINTDAVTGTFTATPDGSYAEQTSPDIPGYTLQDASQATVTAATPAMQTTTPTDSAVGVLYTADPQVLTVRYLDADNANAEVSPATTVTGNTDQTISWTASVPNNYALQSGQASTGTYTLTAGGTNSVDVYLVHATKAGTLTTTDTVHYTFDNSNGGALQTLPDDNSQAINWASTTDLVTNATNYTLLTPSTTVNTPTLTGYTANLANVSFNDNLTAGAAPTDQELSVAYTANPASLPVIYVDDDNNGATVATDSVSGHTGDTGNYTAVAPTNYVLTSGHSNTVPYTLTSDNAAALVIHVKEQITTGTLQTTRTIQYSFVNPNATATLPNTVTQPLTWNTATNEVTGVTTYTPVGGYAAVISPTIDGYTVLPDQAAALNPDVTTTVPALNTVVNVTYSPNDSQIHFIYLDNDTQTQIAQDDIMGKTDDRGTYEYKIPTGYAPIDGVHSFTYLITANDQQTIIIRLKHLQNQGSATTTRTITYEVTGGKEPAPQTQTQTIHWVTTTDEVTNSSTATTTESYAALTPPTIDGYTANPATIAAVAPTQSTTSALADSTISVVYTPNVQTASIIYVDDDQNAATITTPAQVITGTTDSSTTWTAEIPSGYQLASNQAASGSYTFTADSGQTITVHLVHLHTQSTTTTTNTVTYAFDARNGAAPAKLPQPATDSIIWTIDTDEATGVVSYTPSVTSDTIVTPTLTGYTADQNSVSFTNTADGTAAPQDPKPVTVTYSANPETMTVTYFDDTDNRRLTQFAIEGYTGSTGTYTVSVPTGYELAAGQSATIAYTMTADGTDNLTVHLQHSVKQETITTTRTITYVVTGSGQAAPTPVAQTATWSQSTDELTGVVTSKLLTNNYTAVESTPLAGYTVDQTEIPAETPTTATDEPVTVTYTPSAQTLTLDYVDDDSGTDLGSLQFPGVTNQSIAWSAMVPDGYWLAEGQNKNGTTTLTADSQQNTVTIHLVEAKVTSSTNSTRTITYFVSGGKQPAPAAVPQTITWTIITTPATGSTIATPSGDYTAVDTPTLDGYTPSMATVAAENYATQATVPSAENVTVTYYPDIHNITLQYVDDDANDAVVGSGSTLSGATDGNVNWQAAIPSGYALAAGQNASGNYTITAADQQTITIHLVHATTTSTATTTRTITYAGAGVATPASKLQSITWQIVTDPVTHVVTATPTGTYAAVNTPIITGYTADKQAVPAASFQPQSSVPADETVVVTYTADAASATIQYVDDDANEAAVTRQTITGSTGATVSWTANVPSGYELASGQSTQGSYTFTAGTEGLITLHLVHAHELSTTTSTRTIIYVVNGSATAPNTQEQTVTWELNRDAVTQQVVATPSGDYAAVPTPQIVAYTADKSEVPAGELTISNRVPTNSTVTVTYNTTLTTATIRFADTDGKVLQTITLSGPAGSVITADSYATVLDTLKSAGYTLLQNDAANAHYGFDTAVTPSYTITLQKANSGSDTSTGSTTGPTTDTSGNTTTSGTSDTGKNTGTSGNTTSGTDSNGKGTGTSGSQVSGNSGTATGSSTAGKASGSHSVGNSTTTTHNGGTTTSAVNSSKNGSSASNRGTTAQPVRKNHQLVDSHITTNKASQKDYPQTGDAHESWLTLLGTLMLFGLGDIIRRRRRQ